MNEIETLDLRVLVWAAGRDGLLTCGILADAGIGSRNCRDINDLCLEGERGAGCLLLATELLSSDSLDCVRTLLEKQPAWSDLPLILVGSEMVSGARWQDTFAGLGNISFLSRPLALPTLISTVNMALRGRRRQYQVRDLLHQRLEADRRKDEFLAMLAHELRNPLAPIRSAAELLRLAGSPDAKLERARDIIARQVAHMSRLVDDLLDVSRITRGKITLQKETLNLSTALSEVVHMMAPLAQERGLALSVAFPAGSICVEADPTRLQQMVGNALSNALKFTPSGGRVTVALAREKGDAVIRVQDNGVGLSREQLLHVFNLFAQTERTLDRTQGGLGIGLTVLRALAELHDGTAELRSDGEGKGAEVVIRLPALPDGAKSDVQAQAPSVPKAKEGLRILIVDDNVDSADSLSMCLGMFGHSVTCKYDAEGALQAVPEVKPQVAICDIGLPTMDGYELVRRLRTYPALRHCLFIAVTGYGQDGDRSRALAAGFHHHIKKPVDPQFLVTLLSACRTDAAGGAA